MNYLNILNKRVLLIRIVMSLVSFEVILNITHRHELSSNFELSHYEIKLPE
jgi:hypothetical protein